MKILQLGKFYPIQGGIEKVMYDLMCGLSKRVPDLQCDMLCVAAESQPSKIKINSNATLYCAKLNKKIFSTMISFDLISKLRRMQNNYDIIHIHHPDPMVALALFISRFKGKVVLHWHSDILKQKTLLKLYKPLQNWLINRADIVIGTTPKYINESPHLKSLKKKKIAIPIGIEPITFDNNIANNIRRQYDGKHIVFSLGRLVSYKGFEYLIESAKYLDESYVILIGGNGPLKESLQKQIDDNQLNNRVKLLGRISDDDLPAYYSACDVFALSSIWKTEAFGIVQIEAMSCGKPIVATHIPESGVDWVNEDGVSGINVSPENPKELALAIKEITKSQEVYDLYSRNAKQRFKAYFTIDKMIIQCKLVYEELMKQDC